MKRSHWIFTSLFVSIAMLLLVGGFVLPALMRPPDVTIHADIIPRDLAHYSSVVVADDPAHNAYCCDLNTYISIPNINATNVNVANESNQVPVFNFDGSTFVVLHKGRNYSQGLVLTENASELANEHRTIEFHKLESGLYYWEQDGQRELQDPGLYDRELVTPVGG